MSRDEALVAVLNAARALRAEHRERGWAGVNVVAQLFAAVDAVDAVGDDTVTTTATFWCAAPECWRVNDTAGMYCHQHSPAAQWPQVRRRDAVFEVRDG